MAAIKTPERILLNRMYAHFRRLAFPEKVSEISKRTRLNNPDTYKRLQKQRWRNNKESEYARTRKWIKKHPEKQKFYSDTQRRKHPEHTRELKRKEYRKHRARYIERASIWSKNNPHKKSHYSHMRRLQSTVNTEDCSAKIALLRQERFCHWCCCPLHDQIRTVDHVIPLSRGGLHIPDNLVAACKSCNCSKNDKLVEEWEWEMAA